MTRRHLEMAESLADMAGTLVQVRDTTLLSQLIADEACRMFRTPAASVCRLDRSTKRLRAVAVSGDAGSERAARLMLGAEMAALGVTDPRPVIERGPLADPGSSAPGMRCLTERVALPGALMAPMVLDGSIIGALCLVDGPGRLFTEDETRFAQAVAHQAALALENARLHEEAGRQRAAAEAARAEAVAASRLKDEFLAVLSHELRNPLNAIFGWASMLQTGALNREQTEQGLRAIERNAALQAQLVNDLLDVSRIIAGKMELDARVVDVAPVIEEAVEALRRLAADSGVQLHVATDPSGVVVRGDPLRLYQVVTNLVSNAIKFTPAGGRVHVRARRRGRSATITVSDTGRGIPEDLLPVMFEAFRQSTPPRGGGLGLGLSIVRHLVELHGGTVEAASRGEGRGATFTVELPLAPDAVPIEGGEAGGTFRASGALALDGIRALVVDDHEDTRDLIALIVRRYGGEVLAAGSAAQAYEIFRQAPVDVLVSDLGMPGQDGYQLIEQLPEIARETGRAMVPAIALTGFVGPEARERALAAGYLTHTAKPIDPDRLVAIIADVTGRPHR